MNDYSLWGKAEADEAKKARAIARGLGVEYIDLENYPLKQVINRFKTDYFTSTVDYAMALALFDGFDDIQLYGVNMANHSEYSHQKPGVEFWCGYALGLGAKVAVNGKISTIMKTRDKKLYGYGTCQGLECT